MKVFPWQILRAETTFTALGQNEQTSILPSDFDRIIPETFWNRTEKELIAGPITPVEWAGLKANNYTNYYKKWILRGGAINIIPAPTAGDTLAFEYVSKNWLEDVGGTARSVWTADTNTALIDEELITLGVVWEFLVRKSLPANAAAEAYETYFRQLIDNDQPNANILVAGDIFVDQSARHFTGEPAPSGSENII